MYTTSIAPWGFSRGITVVYICIFNRYKLSGTKYPHFFEKRDTNLDHQNLYNMGFKNNKAKYRYKTN